MSLNQIQTRLKTKNCSFSNTNIDKNIKLLKNEKDKLNNEINKLKTKLKSLQLQEDKLNTNIVSYNDLWLDDEYIKSYFDSLTNYISKFRKDVILVNPSTSQIIKEAPLYDVLQTLTPLSFNTVNVAFFCVSDYLNNLKSSSSIKHKMNYSVGRGSHWSLLIYNKYQQMFYHMDSIKGANEKHARQMANNINCEFGYQELQTIQQDLTFECGLHTIVNTKHIIDIFTQENSGLSNI